MHTHKKTFSTVCTAIFTLSLSIIVHNWPTLVSALQLVLEDLFRPLNFNHFNYVGTARYLRCVLKIHDQLLVVWLRCSMLSWGDTELHHTQSAETEELMGKLKAADQEKATAGQCTHTHHTHAPYTHTLHTHTHAHTRSLTSNHCLCAQNTTVLCIFIFNFKFEYYCHWICEYNWPTVVSVQLVLRRS